MKIALAIVALAAVVAVSAQESRPAPRLASGKPDLSGVWEKPYVPDMTKNGKNQRGYPELPFTPAGLKEWQSYDAANGDYTGSCLPFGMTRSFNSPYPMQIVQNSTHVALLFEQNTWFHVVPIIDQPLQKAPAARARSESSSPAARAGGGGAPPAVIEIEPTWFGTSSGRWDGDTLVVDTTGFNGWTRLDTIGHPHSDRLHLVQTFRRTDADHLIYTVTITDPETYTKPWTNERTFTRDNGGLIEYSCEENNKDLREGHIKQWTLPEPKKKP